MHKFLWHHAVDEEGGLLTQLRRARENSSVFFLVLMCKLLSAVACRHPALLQQNPSVLNSGCWLTQVDLCNGSNMACVYVGITPAVTNEVGLNITSDSYDIIMLPRNTRVSAHRVKSVRDRRNRASNAANIAVPNDRACSVRPGDRDQQYESVFNLLSLLYILLAASHAECRCDLPLQIE